VTIGQIISIIFLVVMVVLILRGIRRHPRRNGDGELDRIGNDVGSGIMQMSRNLRTETFDSSGGEGSGGGD
jgi:hypothetical protein